MADQHAIDPSTLQIVLEATYYSSRSIPDHIAVDDAIGEMLVKHGVDRHAGDLWVGYATQSAVKAGLHRTVAAMLARGVSKGDINDALFDADAQDTALLLRYGASPNAYTHNGQTALQVAAAREKDSVEVAGVLLAAGANPNAIDGEGATTLMRIEDPEMAKLLLQHGANINARDWHGLSVIARQEQMAEVNSVEDHNRLLQFLKQHGAQK